MLPKASLPFPKYGFLPLNKIKERVTPLFAYNSLRTRREVPRPQAGRRAISLYTSSILYHIFEGLARPKVAFFLFLQGIPCNTLLSLQGSSCMTLFYKVVPANPICGATRSTPRLLSFHEESNQRRAKEEVSSLDSPPRGFSPRELRLAKFSPPDCSASRRMSGVVPTT